MKSVQANNTLLPHDFLDGFTALEVDQKQQLIEALDQKPPVSVRLNPDKNIVADPSGERIGWCSNGYYLPERPKFTLDPKHHGGAYYVQEAGSMFIEQLFSQSLRGNQPLRVLDLCASPGGKSTLLSSLLPEKSLLVANEVIRARTSILAENIRRWGKGNTAVSSNDASHFGKLDSFFDVIVVDAPCSGEGMFRKDPKARGEWSIQAVETCAARQKRILSDIWPALKPDGILIYSTCTFNDSENEDNVRWLSENFDCSTVHINTQEDWGIMRGDVCEIETFRFLPHRVQSEGFFAAILRKNGLGNTQLSSQKQIINKEPKTKNNNKKKPSKQALSNARNIFGAVSAAEQATLEKWVDNPSDKHFAKIGDSCFAFDSDSFEDLKFVAENLNVCYSGVAMGRFFGSDFKPEHALALYKDLSRTACANIELNLEQAIDYLCKNELEASLFEQGINLLCYKSIPIGWLKRSGNRTTNMLPKELRIVNLNLLNSPL